jgi:hypothetical protein
MAAEITRAEIETLIRKYASQFGVPLDLAMALAGSESSFNPQARGPVIKKTGRRALGLFQIYSEDVKKKYNITNPLDAEQNVRGGLNFFGDLLNDYKGDVPLALSAFNAGKGRMADYGGGVPPFPGLKKYISDITSETAQGTGSTGIGFPWPEERGMPPGQGPAAAPQIQGPQMPPPQTPPLDTAPQTTGGANWLDSFKNLLEPILKIPEIVRDSPALQGLQIVDPDAQEALTAAGVTERLRSSGNEAFEPSLGYRPRSERPDPQLGQGEKSLIIYPDQKTKDAVAEGWRHPTTGELGVQSFQEFVHNNPDFPLPPGAIRIQYDGADPTLEEVQTIYARAYPEGFFTSTNLPIGAGTAMGLGLMKTSGPAAIVAAGGAGGAGEVAGQVYRTQPITDAEGVPRFSIVSAPMESLFGIKAYEGASQNWEDTLWAATVRGMEELIPEGLGRGIGKMIEPLAGALQKASMGGARGVGRTEGAQEVIHGQELSRAQMREIDPTKATLDAPGRFGLGGVPPGGTQIGYRGRGLNRVLKAKNASVAMADRILLEAGEHLPVSIDAVAEILTKTLRNPAEMRKNLVVGGEELFDNLMTQLQKLGYGYNPATKIWEKAGGVGTQGAQGLGAGVGRTFMPLRVANELKRHADALSMNAWKTADEQFRLGSDPAAEMAQQLSFAIRNQMLEAMRGAGKFAIADRWVAQNVRTMATNAAEIAVREGMANPPMRGVAQGVAYQMPLLLGAAGGGYAGAGADIDIPRALTGAALGALALSPFALKQMQSGTGRVLQHWVAPTAPAAIRGGRVGAHALGIDNVPTPGGEMPTQDLAAVIQRLQREAQEVGGDPRQVIQTILEGPTATPTEPVTGTSFDAQQRAYAEMLRRQAEEQNRALTRPLTGSQPGRTQFQGSGIFR